MSKAELVAKLEGDATLWQTLLGGLDPGGNKKIYFQFPLNTSIFPRVTYYFLNDADTIFADDSAIARELVPVIDIWAKSSTTAIFDRVDFLMKQLGYRREYAGDLYEVETGVHHKTTRYRKIA